MESWMESWMDVSSGRADPSGISEPGAHPPLLAILFTSSPAWYVLAVNIVVVDVIVSHAIAIEIGIANVIVTAVVVAIIIVVVIAVATWQVFALWQGSQQPPIAARFRQGSATHEPRSQDVALLRLWGSQG